MAYATKLWSEITLPKWDKHTFFTLFTAFNTGQANKLEENDFALMLMFQIREAVEKIGWCRTLAKYRIDPEEAAAKVVANMIIKARKMKVRHPCALVVISIFNLAIRNELISVQRDATRKTRVGLAQHPEDYDVKDNGHLPADLGRFEEAMHNAEDIVCTTAPMRKAYRRLCRGVLSGTHFPTLDEMPPSIRDSITVDEYAVATFQLNNIINRYAEDLSASVA